MIDAHQSAENEECADEHEKTSRKHQQHNVNHMISIADKTNAHNVVAVDLAQCHYNDSEYQRKGPGNQMKQRRIFIETVSNVTGCKKIYR